MSLIKKISLTQFRNYQQASFEFSAPIVSITGLNGVGKTNLLDAIYYLCYTKSYFTGYQHQLVKHGCDGFRIEGFFEEEDITQKVTCKWKTGKKELFENDVLTEKITDYVGKHTAVMIAPDDIALINEGSEIRRKWLDGILSQVDKQYFESLLQYQQALTQRNAWLKMNAVKAQHDFTILEFYDQQLSQYGTYLFAKRNQFLQEFVDVLKEYYMLLSDGREDIAFTYKSDLHAATLPQLLKKSLHNDLQLQRTLKGVHKDEIDFLLNGRLIKLFGSQGQKKSYLFALKLAQFNYLQNQLKSTPVLLLDDIFDKLDKGRLRALQQIISSENYKQVIMTDTENRKFSDIGKCVEIVTL